MDSKLTTHVLDLSKGLPAQGMKIELWAIADHGEHTFIKEVYTNKDGRVDDPLLQGDDLTPAEYELVFYVGEYFNDKATDSYIRPFLNKVPLRFGISSTEEHYHVPLLVAPGGYSTYRGS
ncbi:hydroxyisourate hydrolase [Peribacillus muralis]|uniref:hydroxyisourate hydrolase n=1 Tax=Peribacillus muralis TaxID=264697 RepID=UPI00070FB8B7|nr:hydroxyisourate hydrolase [Peribacillus muralis]MCK1993943.1 hydroxyisourate hydrolase [Peribacillus muralis]MCK2014498.1 hydroxyisourate hydrolase [Peribacillus muralis]